MYREKANILFSYVHCRKIKGYSHLFVNLRLNKFNYIEQFYLLEFHIYMYNIGNALVLTANFKQT